jgi:putrescine importer
MLPDPPAPAASPVTNVPAPPRLRRVLGLGDLIFYGIVLIQPVGAVGIFGLSNKMSMGHVTTTIFIALVAMMLTAVSYGRMAGLYPAAGSAYTYVGRGLNPHLGFIAGWAMFLDYLVIPVVSVVYGSLSMQRMVDDLAPGLSNKIVSALGMGGHEQRAAFVLWVILFAVVMTFLNLRGIKWTARANLILTAAMCLVIGIFVFDAIRYLWVHQGWAGLFSIEPFYNPRTFTLRGVCTATSLAALTYIGFDGITTLAEDVKEPKRTVPLAIVLVCLFIGLCAGLQVYLAQRVWPDYTTFNNLDTAFFDVCQLVGGKFLFNAMALILAIACLGSALTGQVGAARILFGMGRDNALPRIFASLDRRNNPVLNLWLIGILALAGALLLDYEKAATLINFGAFLAFLGVNLAVVREFWFRPPSGHKRNWLYDILAPGLGFLFCLVIWLSLPVPAKVVGGIWCGIGLIYTAIKTRGFRTAPIMIDLES